MNPIGGAAILCLALCVAVLAVSTRAITRRLRRRPTDRGFAALLVTTVLLAASTGGLITQLIASVA